MLTIYTYNDFELMRMLYFMEKFAGGILYKKSEIIE